MVKEATGSLDQASQIAAITDLTILSGDDSLTLPLLSIGGRGVVSVVGNIVPRDMIALCQAFDAGNIAEAQKWHRKLFPLCRDMLGLATNPIPIKAAMKLLKRDTGELRLPMTTLDHDGEAKLRKSLDGIWTAVNVKHPLGGPRHGFAEPEVADDENDHRRHKRKRREPFQSRREAGPLSEQ